MSTRASGPSLSLLRVVGVVVLHVGRRSSARPSRGPTNSFSPLAPSTPAPSPRHHNAYSEGRVSTRASSPSLSLLRVVGVVLHEGRRSSAQPSRGSTNVASAKRLSRQSSTCAVNSHPPPRDDAMHTTRAPSPGAAGPFLIERRGPVRARTVWVGAESSPAGGPPGTGSHSHLPPQSAPTTSSARSSMLSALSFVKGRGMSYRPFTTSAPTRTSKQPFLG